MMSVIMRFSIIGNSMRKSLVVEVTLRDRIATVESSILEALNGDPLSSNPGVRNEVITAFAGLRVELAELFRNQRDRFC